MPIKMKKKIWIRSECKQELKSVIENRNRKLEFKHSTKIVVWCRDKNWN